MRLIVTLLLIAAFGISVGCGGAKPAPATKAETPAAAPK